MGAQDHLGACLLWVHVDDVLLHAPTKAKLIEGLNHFMDTAVEVGLICNPRKVIPPSQSVKYCGFIYTSITTPMLSIPEDKRTQALAIFRYCQSQCKKPFPALSLAVVTGILQSLVDATPSRIGHTFLRRLHDAMALFEKATEDLPWHPAQSYYNYVVLGNDAWANLEWWRLALETYIHRPIRPVHSDTLTLMFGDGSGTGTGGTLETVTGETTTPLDMWMGVWDRQVYHFSSNWKELCTIRLALQQEAKRPHI